MLKSIQEIMNGKKTYLVTIALLVFAISGFVSGNMTSEQATTLILNALGLGSLRAAVGKTQG